MTDMNDEVLPIAQYEFLHAVAAGTPVVKNAATRLALIRRGLIEKTKMWTGIALTPDGLYALTWLPECERDGCTNPAATRLYVFFDPAKEKLEDCDCRDPDYSAALCEACAHNYAERVNAHTIIYGDIKPQCCEEVPA
jgi:hypothetical protein